MLIFEGLISHEGQQYRYNVYDLGNELRKLEIHHPDGRLTTVNYNSNEEFKDVFDSALREKSGGKNMMFLIY